MRAPVYSHLTYDIVPNEWIEIDRPDILIVEGVNVLQTGPLPRDGKAVPVVSDFFDFSVYIDADEPVLRDWYVQALPDAARHRVPRSRSYFHRYARAVRRGGDRHGDAIWERTNLANLEDNILPTRPRATLILKKGADHVIETVALRRLWSSWPLLRGFRVGNALRAAPRRLCLRSAHHASRREMPRGGQPRERFGELFAIDRFDQKAVHAGLEAGVAIFHQRIGGERQDRVRRPGSPASRARIRFAVSTPSSWGIWMSISNRS